jgi:hypothetical protein
MVLLHQLTIDVGILQSVHSRTSGARLDTQSVVEFPHSRICCTSNLVLNLEVSLPQPRV